MEDEPPRQERGERGGGGTDVVETAMIAVAETVVIAATEAAIVMIVCGRDRGIAIVVLNN